jgi:hypothetical protein
MNISHFRLPLIGLVSVLALVVVTSAAFAAGMTPSGFPIPAAPQASGHVPTGAPSAGESSEPTAEESAKATEAPTAGESAEPSNEANQAAVFGSVTGLGTGTVTIQKMDGDSQTIDLADSTMYFEGGATVTSDALVVGADILAKGTVSSGLLTATSVRIVPSVVIGTVTALASDSLDVETPAGKSVTIDVPSSTRFFVEGVASPTLADLAVGNRIAAFGTMGSNGVLDAAFVVAEGSSNHGFLGLGGFFGNGGSGGNGGVSASHVPSPLPTRR